MGLKLTLCLPPARMHCSYQPFAPPKGVAADLLGVYGTFEVRKVRRRVDGTKEYGFVLVHAGIGEQEGRI